MKTRNGFVSNSSSSSFIIPNSNMKKIALSMMQTMIDEAKDYNDKSHYEYKKECMINLKKALQLPYIKSGKYGIMMKSCNYDTWIIERNGQVYISTCNNHDWELPDDCNVEDLVGEGKIKKIHRDGMFFYNIGTKIFHTKPIYLGDYDDYDLMINYNVNLDPPEAQNCPKCGNTKPIFDFVVDIDGNKICGWCYEGILEEGKKADILEVF